MLTDEEWRPIEGFPSYEVSSFGRIRRVTPDRFGREPRVLKTTPRNGYPRVDLWNGGARPIPVNVHRIVAAAFLGPGNGRHVNHIDGNRLNNHISNLEWVTPRENDAHASRLGLKAFGSRNGNARLSDDQVAEIRAQARRGNHYALADRYGTSRSTIDRIVKGLSRRVM